MENQVTSPQVHYRLLELMSLSVLCGNFPAVLYILGLPSKIVWYWDFAEFVFRKCLENLKKHLKNKSYYNFK